MLLKSTFTLAQLRKWSLDTVLKNQISCIGCLCSFIFSFAGIDTVRGERGWFLSIGQDTFCRLQVSSFDFFSAKGFINLISSNFSNIPKFVFAVFVVCCLYVLGEISHWTLVFIFSDNNVLVFWRKKNLEMALPSYKMGKLEDWFSNKWKSDLPKFWKFEAIQMNGPPESWIYLWGLNHQFVFEHLATFIYYLVSNIFSDYAVNMWDTLKSHRIAMLYGHENRVSSLKISPDGTAIATGSWDYSLKIWA